MKVELTKKEKILVSTILCLIFVHVVHGMLDQIGVIGGVVFTDYAFPVTSFVLFSWSWVIIIINSIRFVFEQFS